MIVPTRLRSTKARRHQLPAAAAVVLALAAGCAAPQRASPSRHDEIAAAARPILEMDPDVVWTDSYNRLLGLAPASIAYLAEHPALQRPAAPDDLCVMLHTSLIRFLADSAVGPRLTASCLETTLGLLHFEIKVDGRPVGIAQMSERPAPRTWHALYPAALDQTLAARIDAEADRHAVLEWWRQRRTSAVRLASRTRLEPRADDLWPLLSRRYADVWLYEPRSTIEFCAWQDGGRRTLLAAPTLDYNLTRAACIWLGRSSDAAVQSRLIDLVGSRSATLAHNARFALQFSPDERIRELMQRYKDSPPAAHERDGDAVPLEL